MAEFWNKKCDIYLARFSDSNAAAVNFFAQKLVPHLNYYLFPPPSLVTAVMFHLQKFQVAGIMIVPNWQSSSFWNNLVPDGVHFAPWVQTFIKFRPSGFVCDPLVVSTTFRNLPTFDVIALNFDFDGVSENEMFYSVRRRHSCLKFGCGLCH